MEGLLNLEDLRNVLNRIEQPLGRSEDDDPAEEIVCSSPNEEHKHGLVCHSDCQNCLSSPPANFRLDGDPCDKPSHSAQEVESFRLDPGRRGGR